MIELQKCYKQRWQSHPSMIEFKNLTRKKVSFQVFKKIYNEIFGKRFELSVVLAKPLLMRELNAKYRHKKGVANVLAFPLEKELCEVFLNAKEQDLPRLFAHACLHLKGYGHKNEKANKIMAMKENKILRNILNQ